MARSHVVACRFPRTGRAWRPSFGSVQSATLLAALVIVTLFVLPGAWAQENEVHIRPRIKTESPKQPQPPGDPDPISKIHTKPIVKTVEVVLVPVTVTDPLTRSVTGLEKGFFHVFEDGAEQEIKYFYSEDAPISLGVIFDVSGSMSGAINTSRDAVIQFFKTANPEDEFFTIAFSDKPALLGDFTQKVEDIQGKLVYTVPKGRTALLDAIYLGIQKMHTARHQKKALLVISDGGENQSRYTPGEVKRVLQEADVQVYAICVAGSDFGPGLLRTISETTGGRMYFGSSGDLADVAAKIGVELRNQYVLGYRPKNTVRDGRWRKIKVKLMPPPALPPLHLSAKSGYYAPEE